MTSTTAHRYVSQSAGNWFKQISWWVGGWGLPRASRSALWSFTHGLNAETIGMPMNWIQADHTFFTLLAMLCDLREIAMQISFELRTSLLCLWSYWTIMINAEEHVMHVPHSGIHHKMLQNFSCHIPVLLGLSATDRLKSSCRVLTDRVPIWLQKVTSSSKWVGEPD